MKRTVERIGPLLPAFTTVGVSVCLSWLLLMTGTHALASRPVVPKVTAEVGRVVTSVRPLARRVPRRPAPAAGTSRGITIAAPAREGRPSTPPPSHRATTQPPHAIPSPTPPAAPTPVAAPTPSSADNATPAGFRTKTRKSGPKREEARDGQAPARGADSSRKGGQGRAKRPKHPQRNGPKAQPKPNPNPNPKPKPKPEPPVGRPAPAAPPDNGGPPPAHKGEKKSAGH